MTIRSLVPVSRRLRRFLIILIMIGLIPLAGQVADRLGRDPDAAALPGRLAAARPPVTAAGASVLCVDAPEFMAAATADIVSARDEVLVQTLAFEADAAGLALARALLESPAARRQLLIDDYSRHVQSDKVVGAPNRLLDLALAREAEQTRALLTQLRAHGVEVRYGRPLNDPGDLLTPRDHKKLVVVDRQVAYTGGINFSAHNFLWHDLMLRMADPAAAGFLADDFARSWAGDPETARHHAGELDLVASAGGGDPAVQDVIAATIDRAEHSLVLQCPYLTEPYLGLLGEARRRGVAVTVLTSERSNRLGMKQGIMDASRRHGLDLQLLPGPMTHVKALLVDDEELLLGSANFDFLSATQQPEIVVITRDADVVADFRARVLAPDLAQARAWDPDETSPVATGLGAGVMNLARNVLAVVGGAGR